MRAITPRLAAAVASAGIPLLAGCVIGGVPPIVTPVGPGGAPLGSAGDPTANGGYTLLDSSPAPSPGVTLPTIVKLGANPQSITAPGQEMALTCEAVDDSGLTSFSWSDTGGTLTANQGQTVDWKPPAQPGNYAVTVLVSSPSGGAVTGAFNVAVTASGSAQLVSTDPASPAPPPVSTPAPTPTPQQDSGSNDSWSSWSYDSTTTWNYDYWGR